MRAITLLIALTLLGACTRFGVADAPLPDEAPPADAGPIADAAPAPPKCAPPALHCDDFGGTDFSSTWSKRPARFITQVASGDAKHGKVATVSLPTGTERGSVREALFRDIGALEQGRYRLSYALRVEEIPDADKQDIEVSAFQVANRNFHVNIRVEGGERRIGFGVYTGTGGTSGYNEELERTLANFEIGKWQTVVVDVEVGKDFVITKASAHVGDQRVTTAENLDFNPADKSFFFVAVGATYVADIPADTRYSIDDVVVTRVE